jgi:uncharacterized membrane protein
MNLKRILKHLVYPDWLAWRALPAASLARIETAIADSEVRHTGEIRFAVEASLGPLPLLRGQSARQRAVEVFSDLRVWDTEANNGVLVYLLLADRDVEIVADRGITQRVPQERWEDICREMERRFRAGRYEEGVIQGIAGIGRVLESVHPRQANNPNELPDRPLRL